MTTSTAAVTDADRIAIVKLLADGMGLGLVIAANPHLDPDLIREVANDHGYPHVAKLQRAHVVLVGRNATDDAAPTVHTPAHVVRENKAEPQARPGMFDVPVEDLVPSPNNPREHMTDIEDLAASIREAGLIQPIVAQRLDDGTLQILAGHRRHAAVVMLGWQKVPVIVRKAMLPDAELVAMLVENGQRAGLDPIEEARALNHLKVTANLNDSQLAKKVGRAQSTVSSRLSLLSLSFAEQEAIRNGEMTLVEGKARGRIESGRVRHGAIGRPPAGHLSVGHDLAQRVKARCVGLKHSRGRGVGVGGIACGQCWEAVIRADERESLHRDSATQAACALCGGKYGA